MRLFFLFFLFFPFSQSDSAYSPGSKATEVKDYCPNAEEGNFNVQKSSYKNLLAALERKDKKKWKKKKKEGSGKR